jgi:hypothetical protein
MKNKNVARKIRKPVLPLGLQKAINLQIQEALTKELRSGGLLKK